MTDNTTLNSGTGGDVIGSDDISGVKYQRVKLIHGADGTNAGDISTVNGFPTVGGNVARTSAAWTSATAQDTALSLAVTNYATATLTLRSTSTITGGVIIFEVSDDNSNWYPVVARITGSQITHLTDTLTANETESWIISVAGWTNFRVRLNPAITGSGTVNLGLAAYAAADASNPMTATERATGATLTNVASSASSVSLLLAQNDSRIGVLIFNDSTAVCYVKYGTTASTSSYTVQIGAGGYWEMPKPIYTGAIDAIWSAANGNARITVLTSG